MPVDRRTFFRKFFAESISAIEEMRGIPQFRLDEIESLPIPVLEEIVPTSVGQDDFCIRGNRLIDNTSRESPPKTIRTFTADEMEVLDLFDGRRSLRAVARELSAENRELDPEQAFALASRLFCDLARRMVYIPAGGHDRDSGARGPKKETTGGPEPR
jgi:hypothetical protein